LTSLNFAQGIIANGGAGAVPGARERIAKRADDKAAHQPGIAETDLGFGGVNIYIYIMSWKIQVKGNDRMAVPRKKILTFQYKNRSESDNLELSLIGCTGTASCMS